MRVLLNIIWLVVSGLWLALGYWLAGLLAFVLIITIPFGVQAFKIGAYALWPFGRAVVPRPDAGGASLIGNVLWVILFGWWLALGHIVSAVLLALTIIGLPLAFAHFKLVPVALLPFGMEIVPLDRIGDRRPRVALPAAPPAGPRGVETVREPRAA